jgi:hypothetical protein
VWAAGPREAALALALQIVAGLGTGAMVLVGQRVLSGVLDSDRSGGDVGDFLPAAAARDPCSRCWRWSRCSRRSPRW